MLLTPESKKECLQTSKFLDFDKNERIFYNNLYIDDYKCVVKMPLFCSLRNTSHDKIKIEKFDLGKYTYLLSFE